MSRIEYNDPDCVEDELRMYAFGANTERHLKGKKGQLALKELEAALLALPEKRLEYSKFVVRHGEADDVGAVCALGAVALKRCMDSGMSRAEAIKKLEMEVTEFDEEAGDSHWENVQRTAGYMGCKVNFAWAVIEANDEGGRPTPEGRYKRVLEWCQQQIIR